ncbi:hypothetical protein SLA2020_289450 [Shorea laevis]
MKTAPHLQSSTIILIIVHMCISHHLGVQETTLASALQLNNQTDKLALLALKDRILEDPLMVMSSWNETLHFCEWKGVSCSRQPEGRVIMLNLAGQHLVGSVPPHIGNLTFLRHMDLNSNMFNGEIPREVGHLFRLRYLNLSGNAFQGKIPSNLGFCSNLQVISLNGNSLEGEIPDELRNLSKQLDSFSISRNYHITGRIPRWLGNASSLVKLSLKDNKLHGSIPAELGRLSKLQFLQLTSNHLSGMIPSSIYNLSSLEILCMAENQLHGEIPWDIGTTLPNVQMLYFGLNHFSGPIPVSLANASKLEWFSIGYNNLSGAIPSTLGSLRSLKELHIPGNNLEVEGLNFLTSLTNNSDLYLLDLGCNLFRAELPASLANFSSKLEYLYIDHNQISGNIPKEIGNLIGLRALELDVNHIGGEVPPSIGKLEKLVQLILNQNRISGQIPSSLGNLSQLNSLDMHENNLMGRIPPSLGNCSYLQLLWLDNNHLVGKVPMEVVSLSSITFFSMAQNSLTGALPQEVGNMSKLLRLNVSHNKLSGEIPSALGSCLMLEELQMQDNLFKGSIPSSFITLNSLVVLDLSRNNLSGQIPKYLQSFTLLHNLNLSFNNLEGEVPHEGVFQNGSATSVFGNQKLCGGFQKLGLPSCEIIHGLKKKKAKSLQLKVVVSITASCSLLMVSFFIIYYLKRKPTKREVCAMMQEQQQFSKISYAELSQATGEFSSSNLIGKGSFGSVYKGIMGRDGMSLAVKVFHLGQKGAFKSFMAECGALRNIRHRNLIKIVSVCSSADYKGAEFKAIIYEFMQNGSLEGWLHPNEVEVKVKNLNFIQRLNIAIEVGSATEYLHYDCQPAIVHGDLKPSNVLLDHDMVARVADFGLSRFQSESIHNNASKKQSSSMGVRGTVGYVAPEYGMGGKASISGDVYSFGIMLLEMVTGKRPTDSMFKDCFTIHQFTKAALPENVMDILDPSLLQEVYDAEKLGNNARRVGVLESIIAVARVGVICSMESPKERIEMKKAVAELCAIKQEFLGNTS